MRVGRSGSPDAPTRIRSWDSEGGDAATRSVLVAVVEVGHVRVGVDQLVLVAVTVGVHGRGRVGTRVEVVVVTVVVAVLVLVLDREVAVPVLVRRVQHEADAEPGERDPRRSAPP